MRRTVFDNPSEPLGGGGPLISEIERYLEAVDVFRSEGCEPQWRAFEPLHSDLRGLPHGI